MCDWTVCQQRANAITDSSTHYYAYCCPNKRTDRLPDCSPKCYSYCSTDHVTDCCTNRCRVPMWQLLHPRAACADTLTSVCGRQIPAGATTGVRP